MALVCDIKSNPGKEEIPSTENQEDLEDGEIEDDDEEMPQEPTSQPVVENTPPPVLPQMPAVTTPNKFVGIEPKTNLNDNRDVRMKDRPERRRHEEKGRKHMTEAEKSILHLRKREKMQREKWEKLRKEPGPEPLDDDFAINIEKTLASILNKKEKTLIEEEKDEEKRGSKRKKHDKDRSKGKQRRLESPKNEDIEEIDLVNVRSASPDKFEDKHDRSQSPHSDESYDSEYSSESGKETRKRDSKKNRRNRGEHNRDRKYRDRDRENRRNENQLKDAQGVCVFYLQGKCQKVDCPYSHEAVPPMKLELCKFYMMDCCAKGENCSYMHSEFPCKFYHTGLECNQGENCKFAHGKPLSDRLKQILFKHIETAPRDILGGFPRMGRDEALDMINETQKKLQDKYGVAEIIPSLFDINVPVPPELRQGGEEVKTREKAEKPRNRPSRWQDPDPKNHKDAQRKPNFQGKPFAFAQDLDMRINSNGDVDMRTLPPPGIIQPPPPILPTQPNQPELRSNEIDVEQYKREAGLLTSQPTQDVDIRNQPILSFNNTKDVDIRQQTIDPRLLQLTKDIDIRQIASVFKDAPVPTSNNESEDEPALKIDSEDEHHKEDGIDLPPDLPKIQRDLFLRVQAHQKENLVESQKESFDEDVNNINWYSDDDDDDENRLTIKVDNDEFNKDREEAESAVTISNTILSPPQIKPLEVVEKLGDLSKIDISAEVTKLLTSMSQSQNTFSLSKEPSVPAIRDPRQQTETRTQESKKQNEPKSLSSSSEQRMDPRTQDKSSGDPRRSRQSSTDSQNKSEKISIYEQGSIDKNLRIDEDLEAEDLEFKGSGRSDVDLRSLQLPFKGMQNYTPATEIDASINSHLPITWKVLFVEIPRPDYTGLKLSVNDAEKTGDPRLRKIFRLSVDEKDSPASPKASPKASNATRVDPRLRKQEEAFKADPSVMNFNQQLNMLQSSAFYQSLTSNQKVLLNQEIASRTDQSGSHDPMLNSMLSNLNLIPGATLQNNSNLSTAINILASVTKLNPMLNPAAVQGGNIINTPVNPAILGNNSNLMNQMAQSIVQPGLLGAAPGIPNLPPEFSINFDPRNGGLLGNAPPPFGNFPPEGNNFGNFNEDFYPPDNGNNFGHNGGNNRERGFNRDRRRGRNNFNRNNGNRNFRNRNNRSNRSHTPP